MYHQHLLLHALLISFDSSLDVTIARTHRLRSPAAHSTFMYACSHTPTIPSHPTTANPPPNPIPPHYTPKLTTNHTQGSAKRTWSANPSNQPTTAPPPSKSSMAASPTQAPQPRTPSPRTRPKKNGSSSTARQRHACKSGSTTTSPAAGPSTS